MKKKKKNYVANYVIGSEWNLHHYQQNITKGNIIGKIEISVNQLIQKIVENDRVVIYSSKTRKHLKHLFLLRAFCDNQIPRHLIPWWDKVSSAILQISQEVSRNFLFWRKHAKLVFKYTAIVVMTISWFRNSIFRSYQLLILILRDCNFRMY